MPARFACRKMRTAVLATALLLQCGCIGQQPKPAGTLVVRDYVPASQVRTADQDTLEPMAMAGDPEAQYRIGQRHYDGMGVPRSHRRAMEWWLRAANAGHAGAQYSLGVLYFDGVGIKTDFAEGCRWLGAAARQGVKPAADMYSARCAR